MNQHYSIYLTSLEEFVAHAIALKDESEERLDHLGHCLAEHNNPEAARVFQQLAEANTQAIQELQSVARNMTLPQIPPWEFQWHCADDPDALCIDEAHYLMSVRQSLKLALFNELRNLQFFEVVHESVEDQAIKDLAQRLIQQEQVVTMDMQQRIDNLPEDEQAIEDLDPPNMPE